ncbi:PTS beta-glucoside transporter subunit EIIBCA [Enterococcus silesiacus]|uniref:PTS system sucrose-specific EIIBCA component n=1 Tax=Enterococcus silesiacus TaxID=332949 RepID=A0A0S3KCS8_9ENTE|nr:beta-glucoside-specific PTS transporter subunit IIABC [Enterococcus silesiacus]ALS02076.1 PTS beta-glucoside transporter subunit EIIBCA [Enterococcus silesiacus]OJG91559.1 PTS beta-glucoside transporter subunit IIABC [Enterococcus silesiacus]
MDTNQLAEKILKEVGGEENVQSLVHCATRLRFKLKDRNIVDKSAVESIPGVVTVMESAGQFQVVIGNTVPEVYAAIGTISNLTGDQTGSDNSSNDNETIFGKFVDLISSLFTPLLGVMAGAGILKGLLSIATTTKLIIPETSTYIILSAIADSLFYFLPVLLAITAARKFKANVFVAVTIAGALVYPTIIGLAAPDISADFFGIPVVMVKYTSTVIPIILAIYVMSVLEKFLNKRLHQSIKNFITPMILLVVIVPLTLMIFGPFGVYVGNAIADVLITVINFNPIIAGALIAASWQILVMFGLHWGIVPVMMNNIATMGKDPLKPSVAISVFAQAGAVLGVMLKTKNKEFRALSASAVVTALFGITEPAVYGVTLRLKRPFIIGVISAAVGGGIVGYAGSMGYAAGPSSILMIPAFYGPNGEGFVGFLIGIAVAFVLAAVLTYFIGFEDIPEATTATKETTTVAQVGVKSEVISSPLAGDIVSLENINDKAFASGTLGQGLAIAPTKGEVISPVNGTVTMAFATGHAVGVTSENGAEVLIHIGLDTVQLEGKHFELKVTQGQTVKVGEPLVVFDIEAIKAAGFDVTTPVIITNTANYEDVVVSDQAQVNAGDRLITLL